MATQEEVNKLILDAARLGDVNSVEEWINKKADVNGQEVGLNGQRPLHWAAWNAKTDKVLIELLIKSGASLNTDNCSGETPLHTAVCYGRTEAVDILITKGASLSVVDCNVKTPLHFAAKEGTQKIIVNLLESGASPFAFDKNGETPLHTAAWYGKANAVDILIKKGASLSVVNSNRKTPLHLAAWQGRPEVVKIMLNAEASLSAMDNKGRTPLHTAAANGRTKVVDLLLKKRASQSALDNKGQTPLHSAAEEGRTDIIDILLLESVTSLYVMDKEGKTPYDVAHDITKDRLQEYLNKGHITDMPSNTDEIVAQFPTMDTSEMKEIFCYENCVYLGGACSVGKSTLASILIGEEISQHWKSTNGLTTYFGRNGIDLKNKEMVPLKQATIQEDIKQEIREGTYKIGIAPSDLAGFGGHMFFDMTHQLFMQQKVTFVLMFNGTIDFSIPLKEFEQEETTESILKHWVNSILSYCADDEDILPIIMFSATHSDDFNQEDRKDRKKKLIENLREMFENHKRQKRIMYDDIFFINGKDENDPEIKNLKVKLVEVACAQNSWGKRMSMACVPLELQMSELRLHNMNIISKEELITLNQRNEDLALTVEQIKFFLNDQHSLGKILYFDQHGLDNFIIVQPQLLVNILSSFITAKNFWPKDKELEGILCALTDTGKISKQDLLKLWSQKQFHQHMPNDYLKEFIMQVLVHLDILVEPKHYNRKQESKIQSYIVPCIVKRRLPVTDFYVKSADKMICLSYTFVQSFIPAALSFKLIGAAINLWPLQETPEGICLYHQAAILCVDGSNELHILVEDDKVFVYLINKVNKGLIPPNIASTVQECLTMTMTKVIEFYHKRFGKSLSTSEVSKAFRIEVGEWCTSGGGCYISVPEVKEKKTWSCKNNKEHNTKYPLYWIFNKLFMEDVTVHENANIAPQEIPEDDVLY